MAKQIKQLRYFGESDARNYPSTISAAKLSTGAYMENWSPILQISVHTLPGVVMYFNDDTMPVYVGHSGVYQLDMTDTTAVLNNVKFSLKDLQEIAATNFGLIIDLMYEDGYAGNPWEEEEETIITSTGGKATVNISSNIKNIWKNIWHGVTEKEAQLRPFTLQENSAVALLRAEKIKKLRELRDMYLAMIDSLDQQDESYSKLLERMTCCYKNAIRLIAEEYDAEIKKYERDDDITPVGPDYEELRRRIEILERLFEDLELDSIEENGRVKLFLDKELKD